MNNLQVFKNDQFGEIRTVEIGGEPWFVGKDIAERLGYTNPQKAVRDHIDEEDKTLNESFTVNGTPIVLINESGLYSLVLSSKLPTAKQFKRWVTAEVIPSIRKHGAYMTPETIEKVLLNPDTIINLASQLKSEREKRIALEGKVEEDKPKVIFADAVSTAKNSILIGELAKLLKQNGVDMGQNRLFKWLREHGYLIKRKGLDYNMPTQRSMELGLFEIKETAITHADGHISISKTPKVTGKGQQYFVNLFLNDQTGETS
jgi:phage antirepressor YoqD-like protein